MKDIPFERSFASHPKSKYWSELNELKPEQVFKSSHKKLWFNCEKCNHEFESPLNSITNGGNWCPFCHNLKLCEKEECNNCFEKSFASHLKSKYWSNKNKLKTRQVFKGTPKKYLFDCDICNHEFDISINAITSNNNWCIYCVNQKLCKNDNCKECFEKSFASHTKSKYWSNKNKLQPRQVFNKSDKKFWFDCNKCNNEFNIRLAGVTSDNNWCSKCKHKTELKLFDWLKKQKYDIKSQVKFVWCKNINHLPFDFVLEQYKLIIELDGPQHFKQISNWQSPNESKIKDDFKNKMSLENDYSIIRISQEIVLFDKEEWENQLKQVIKKYDNPKLIKIGNIYN